MKRLIRYTLVALALGSSAAYAGDDQSFTAIQKGRDLAILGDCAACHTAPGGQAYAGGLELQTPFGIIASSNITPDRETGIGAWSDEQFYNALHNGTTPHGSHLYPAMPYPAYTKLTREDTDAIHAYLQTLQPVNKSVVTNRLPFPFNIRADMAVWNALNFTEGTFKPDPQKSPEWNRGAYIVEGLGHCGTCHTPKNVMGGDKNSAHLEGASLQGWFAPNITNDQRLGIGSWSEDDLVQYLKTGSNARTIASGPMAEEIEKSSARWTDADLKAVAVYLKDLKPAHPGDNAQPIAADDKRMTAGAAIYKDRCAGCHQDSGKGGAKLFPALAGSAIVQQPDATTLMRVVLQGSQGAGTSGAPTHPAMPSFSHTLNDDQVASVLTYIRNSWGNAASAVAGGDVKSLRKNSPGG
ncbi:Cytochrome c, mono-and diheme variants [Faunimonas pinastri]|uniref:Cytochrome c, mono-and diheme variants n=1 Tax=Faunimonas pinastri TaxID=1855383 RepID=A0A1H9NUF7_9HYPH|nr:cytochrome c [Faunimonas pinastri]SER39674.1 Cytochrome c, mono-and diheme variants [Faunimonas pinastri]